MPRGCNAAPSVIVDDDTSKLAIVSAHPRKRPADAAIQVLGKTPRYPIEQLDQIEVENKEPKPDRRVRRLALPWKSTGAAFRLSLVDASNREVCSIDGLTEGESHWMADVIRAGSGHSGSGDGDSEQLAGKRGRRKIIEAE